MNVLKVVLAALPLLSCAPVTSGEAPPPAQNNSALRTLTTASGSAVVRQGYKSPGDAPPLTYVRSSSPCLLNGGAGDGGSQVPSADGGCWLASFGPGPIDARWFGASYPVTLHAAASGDDHGGANFCLDRAHPCTAQGAIRQALRFDAKGQYVTVFLAAGRYDTSLFVAGLLNSHATSSASLTDGALLRIVGAGSNATYIEPTGSLGCSQNYGDGLTVSNHGGVLLDRITIGTGCPGRSGAFLQNFAYLTIGPDVQWASAPAQMVHVEADAYFEAPRASPFIIAANATSGAALAVSTGGIANFDGDQIRFNGDARFLVGFMAGNSGGEIQWLPGTTVDLNGHGVAGPGYALYSGTVFSNASSAVPPGSAGKVASNAVYVSNSGVAPGPIYADAIAPASKCGALHGSAGCVAVTIEGVTHYAPVW